MRQRWHDCGGAGFVVAIALCAAVAAASILDHQRHSQPWIKACCGEQDAYPLPLWLLRLPGSLIAPARALPVWGSLAQILVLVGIAEAAVGRVLTVVVAAAGHVVSTLAGRLLMAVGPGHMLGVPGVEGRSLDTGPSAATVALTAYLAVVLRCPILGSVAGAGIATAAFMHSDLAGREHLTAWLVGMSSGGVHLLALRRSAARTTPQQVDHASVSNPKLTSPRHG